MHIDYSILIAFGGVAKKIEKGAYIFKEEETPKFYYQILQGEVKIFTSNKNGKELIQGIYKAGQSFGEPSLLLDKPYLSSAQATQSCVLVSLRKEKFLEIIKEYPEICTKMIYTLAERMYDYAAHAQILVSHTPEEKIYQFLNKHKKTFHKNTMAEIAIPYTRQQIADITGLRVETVIRTIKSMHKKNKVKLINHKIYY